MKNFFGNDFLISNQTGQILYDRYAKDMPIFDYHNHLEAQEILEKKRFRNITELLLAGDHYKWRTMRIQGIKEEFITGNGDDFEKFRYWAETVEKIPGNPLYHWTHLELQRYFDIYEPLTSKNAKEIYDKCNEKLSEDGYDALGLLMRLNVKVCGTTNEPTETLEYHRAIREQGLPIKVIPTYRPDKIVEIGQDTWLDTLRNLEIAYDISINSLDDIKKAIELSIKRFAEAGALASDHGFINFVYKRGNHADEIVKKAFKKEALSAEEIAVYKGEILYFLGLQYNKSNWVMQLHMGALRNNSTRRFKEGGVNIGYDSVGEITSPALLSRFLDDLDITNELPKTVLYSLNPADYPVLSTMAVNYANSNIPGKVQLGSAWWFSDNVRGTEKQIDELLETGLLSTFIGMLTDSRSFSSFSRHEFFRRILCNKLGKIVEDGEYPNDIELLGGIVKDISYNNAEKYFGKS